MMPYNLHSFSTHPAALRTVLYSMSVCRPKEAGTARNMILRYLFT